MPTSLPLKGEVEKTVWTDDGKGRQALQSQQPLAPASAGFNQGSSPEGRGGYCPSANTAYPRSHFTASSAALPLISKRLSRQRQQCIAHLDSAADSHRSTKAEGSVGFTTIRPSLSISRSLWPRSSKMMGKTSKYDEDGSVKRVSGKGSNRAVVATREPSSLSFGFPSLLSPSRKGLLSSVANTFTSGRRPETPPAVARAMEGVKGSNSKLNPSNSARDSPSRQLLSSQAEKEREGMSKTSEENGIFSWSDSQLAQRYTFDKEIGFGNWGSCWLAQARFQTDQLQQGSKVAVKLVHRQGTPPSNARVKALWNEFKVLRSCGRPVHSNLVHFREFVITPSYALVVMEYYQQTMNVALPISTYAGSNGYFHQLLSSIDWLHSKSVTHCDIKVANLLVDIREDKIKGRPILVDFGFATIHDSTSNFMSKQSWGTPEYLSPERSRADLHDERLSDIWALGVTFFEIATGRTPFEHDDEQFLSKSQLEVYYERTLDPRWVGTWSIPYSLESLCRCMLSPEAKDRILSSEALKHPFFTKPGEEMEEELSIRTDGGLSLVEGEPGEVTEEELSELHKRESDSKVTGSTRAAAGQSHSTVVQQQHCPIPPSSSVAMGRDEAVEALATLEQSDSRPCSALDDDDVRRSVAESDDASFFTDKLLHQHEERITNDKEIDKPSANLVPPSLASSPSPKRWFSPSKAERMAMQSKPGQTRSTSLINDTDGSTVEETLDSSGEESRGLIPRRELTDYREARPKTVHGTCYNVAHDRDRSESMRFARKPVNYQTSDSSPSLAKKNRAMAYEIMADKRASRRVEEGERSGQEESGGSGGQERSRDGSTERLETMAGRVREMETDPHQQHRLAHSPNSSIFSAKSEPHAEELAARLDEMGVLAASLARMVEETKSKLNDLNDVSNRQCPSLDYRTREAASSGVQSTPRKSTRKYSVTKVDSASPAGTVKVFPADVVVSPGSPKSDKAKAYPLFSAGSLRRKMSMTLSGRKEPEAGSVVPFPNEGHSQTHGQTPRGGHKEVEAGMQAKAEGQGDDGRGGNGQQLGRANSTRGRALSHFLTRYGSRNKSMNLSGGSEEDSSTKTSATLYDRGSSVEATIHSPYPPSRSTSVRRPSSAVTNGGYPSPSCVKVDNNRSSQHFFDDEGVVNVGGESEDVRMGHGRGRSSSLESSKDRVAAREQQAMGGMGTRQQSRVYRNQVENDRGGNKGGQTVKGPPVAPSAAATRRGGLQREGRLSKMKSFTLGRSNSIQTASTVKESEGTLEHHRPSLSSKSTSKAKRNTLLEADSSRQESQGGQSPPTSSTAVFAESGGNASLHSIRPMSPLTPLVGEDPPRRHQKSREANQQAGSPCPHSSTTTAPNTPNGGLWSRLFRSGNGLSRHQTPRAAPPSTTSACR